MYVKKCYIWNLLFHTLMKGIKSVMLVNIRIEINQMLLNGGQVLGML